MNNAEPDYCFTPAQTPRVGIRDGRLFPVHRIYCVGQNYAAHTRELGGDPDRDTPVFFSKPADAVTHSEQIPFPPASNNLHHEVELVVALGQGGANIPVTGACNCVFGYAVGVDLTRRDLQEVAKKSGMPWDMSKGFDLSAPISEIVPADQARDPGCAVISLDVNGQSRQCGSTTRMIWSVAEIISTLSGLVTLQAGDLIFTGTPEGVGPLVRGDRVYAAIERLGHLEFLVT